MKKLIFPFVGFLLGLVFSSGAQQLEIGAKALHTDVKMTDVSGNAI